MVPVHYLESRTNLLNVRGHPTAIILTKETNVIGCPSTLTTFALSLSGIMMVVVVSANWRYYSHCTEHESTSSLYRRNPYERFKIFVPFSYYAILCLSNTATSSV
jgi:hypothetical protein